jgi:hypothetical protein
MGATLPGATITPMPSRVGLGGAGSSSSRRNFVVGACHGKDLIAPTYSTIKHDEAANKEARKYLDGHDIEICDAARLMAKLSCEQRI